MKIKSSVLAVLALAELSVSSSSYATKTEDKDHPTHAKLEGAAYLFPDLGGEEACVENARESLFDQYINAIKECQNSGGDFTFGDIRVKITNDETCVATQEVFCK